MNADGADAAPDQPTGRPCPICGKPGRVAYRPFCSKRCADVDLGRWLSGGYAIPAAPDLDEDDESLGEEIPDAGAGRPQGRPPRR